MKWLVGIVLVLMIVVLFMIMTKVKVKIRFQHVHRNDKFVITYSAWFGLIHYTMNVPVIHMDADSAAVEVKEKTGTSDEAKTEKNKRFTPEDFIKSLKNVKNIVEHVVNFHKIIRHFLKKVQVKQFEWHSKVGIGDAAETAVVVGGCWAIKGSIIGLLTNYLSFSKMPTYLITPDFQNKKIETIFSCILYFRIGQAIVTGIKLFRYWKGSKIELMTDPFGKQTDYSN